MLGKLDKGIADLTSMTLYICQASDVEEIFKKKNKTRNCRFKFVYVVGKLTLNFKVLF